MELLSDLLEEESLGKVVGHVYVIEFQNRGLPHSHILIILDEKDKLITSEDYDRIVCAEIPDKTKYPMLFVTAEK
jgi:hypothetical protein